ncbi:MAG: hypothetical protein WAM39_20225 [Bryobacteraceae bacterium]
MHRSKHLEKVGVVVMVNRIASLVAAAGLFITASAASTIPVQVIGTTQTRAVFAYNAPDTNACSVTVLDSSNNVAHDTDPTLFSGAGNDLGPGNLATGTYRTVVVGRRTSDLALDGKLYSRALQADSPYTFQVSCDGGASTGSITFRTRTIPVGNSAPDPFPFNSNGYGNYAYPSIDYSNTATTYIDPQTGVLLKRLTTPGYGSPGTHTELYPLYAYDLSGNWTNAQNVLAQDGQYASYSGAGGGSDAIFLPTASAEGQRAYIDYSENYVDDMLARLNGYGDQSNAADRSLSVCLTVDAGQTCIGNTLTFTLPQSTAAEVDGPGTYPSPFFSGWGAPEIQVDWMAADFGGNSRSVSAVHTTVINTTPLLFGTFQLAFPSNLKPGMHIHIAGSAPTCPNNDCSIVSGTDATHLTIQQDLGASFNGINTTLTSAVTSGASSVSVANTSGFIKNFYGYPIYVMNVESDSVTCTALSGNTFSGCSGIGNNHASGAAVTGNSFIFTNFGLKIWKQTGNGTIYLDSVKYDYASSADYYTGYEGEGLICSGNVTATYAADGVTPLSQPIQGQTCIISDLWGDPFLYFFDPSSGELRTIARLSAAGVTQDTSNPLLFYQYDSDSGNIYTCSYDATDGHYRTLPTDYNPDTNPYFSCNGNLTSGTGNDVISQIKSKYPQIDMNYWGAPQFSSVQGGYATFQLRPNQNAMAWGCYFDVTQPPGQQLVYCGNSWSQYPLRWAGMHGGFGNRTPDGWLTFATMGSLESAGTTAAGQYTMTVNKIYDNNNATSLSATFIDPSTCEQLGVTNPEWIAQGATGNNCIKVNVATEPVNVGAPQSDLATGVTVGTRPTAWPHNSTSCGGDGTTLNCWSYLQPLGEGDWLRDLNDPGGDYGAERFLVAKKIPLDNGTIDLVLSRQASAVPVSLCVGAETNHPSGFTFMVDLPFGCGGNEYWMNALDPTHTIYADNPVPYGAHTNLQYDTTAQKFTQWTPYAYGLGGYNTGQYGFGYGVRAGQLPAFFSYQYQYGIEMLYTFNGSINGLNAIQTHPGSALAYDTFNNRSIWGLDGRPLGGAGGGDPNVWYHNLSLVSGSQHVYKISLPLQTPGGQAVQYASLDRKRRAVFGWYAHNLMRDISGPGSQITDATTDSFCIADFSNECVQGSQQGDQFVSVVNPDLSGECVLWYVRKTPCLASLPNEVARYTQYDVSKADPTGVRWRTLTSFFGGPGRTDNYANVHGTDGTGWVFAAGKWVDGVRSEIYGAKLPSWQLDSQYRGDFIQVPVKVGGRTGDTVRVRFGYDTNLYCTSRQEACSTGAANNDPFAWLSEPVNWQACGNGCTVNIPALGGRVLYYVVDRKDVNQNVTSSAMQVVTVN